MKHLLAACALAALLAGCASSSPAGQAVTKTVTFTTADLTNAIAISKAAGDTDHGVECFTWLNGELPQIQAALAPATPASVTGVFSALETANVVQNAAQTGVTPALRSAAEEACGPYVMNVEGGLTYLVGLATAAGAKVSLPPLPTP